jgi:tRNA (cmo5U34)-methyltransferase
MNAGSKSSVEEIRARFDRDVERFSDLSVGQKASMDSLLCMDLVAGAAVAATPGARDVLDIGCGAGNYSLKLRERLPEVRFTLVDLSIPMLQRARDRLCGSVSGVQPGDIRAMEFSADSFDVIVAAAVFHHLRTDEEWARTFQNLYRWLRPGGSAWVFDLVAHENPAIERLMRSRYGAYLEEQGGAEYRAHVEAYVEREDTPRPVTDQVDRLRAAGFRHVDILHKSACFAAFGAVKG